MATVRFFAQARDEAGCRTATIEGSTVGEVLDNVRATFGPRLAKVLDTSAVWLNGEFAGGEEAVGDADEVAVLPPVSGG